MNNSEALTFFKQMSIETQNNPQCVKMNSKDESQIDAAFILKYADNNASILDLGSGTGLIVNKIYNKVKSIDCIEPIEDFSKYIVKSDNVKVINKNMFDFNTDAKFDLITVFGVLHYFNKDEAMKIYRKYFNYLKKQGTIIIKNQFALKEDVNIQGFSKELKSNYYAQYRNIDSEISILQEIGYTNIKKFDIYPPESNRWDNTHFYAIVANR